VLRIEEYIMPEKMKVLIAYDGSSCADTALDDLRRAGLPQVAEALIIAVADVFLPPPSDVERTFPEQVPMAVQSAWTQATHALEEARTLAMQAQNRVQASFPDWDVSAEACADSPAWAIIKKADTWQPDLIVVGSHGRSTVGRLLLGSVSYKVVTETHCSVRVGRGGHKAGEVPVRLVIGVDGSADAVAAVHAVAARLWPTGSEMRLVAVLDSRMLTALAPSRPPVAEWANASAPDEQAWVHQMVEALAEQLRATGLTVSSIMKPGDPKDVLLDEARHWEADCIVVGARGLSRIERFLLGSVAAAVTARAHCSVEVIRSRRTR
jgi:nucleotide-binding universal stress UspA family protein